LLNSVRLELYCHGNLTPEETIDFAQKIKTKLKMTKPSVQGRLLDNEPISRVVALPRGKSYRYCFKVKQNMNGVSHYFQAPDNSLRTKHMMSLLQSRIEPEHFDQLRNKEDLAYSLGCPDFQVVENSQGLWLFIESPSVETEVLYARTEVFIESFIKSVSELTEEEFLSFRESMDETYHRSLTVPKSLVAFAEHFADEFALGTYRFEEVLNNTHPFREISLSLFQEFTKMMLSKETRRVLVLHTADRVQDNKTSVEQNQSELKKQSELSQVELITDVDRFKQEASILPNCMRILFVEDETEQFIRGALTQCGLGSSSILGPILGYYFDSHKTKMTSLPPASSAPQSPGENANANRGKVNPN
jgi:secreted Zn-dependent insulinase-like peptidase